MTAAVAAAAATAAAAPAAARAPGRAARFPRVTTRGAYDLATGRLRAPSEGGRGRGQGRGRDSYRLYPRSYFDGLGGGAEIAVMVHGLRNGPLDALRKFEIARGRLRELGYAHPVVGYSYDANTRGAGAAATRGQALAAGLRIARGNGPALAAFVRHARRLGGGGTMVRLLGHSLGSQVILSAALEMARGGGQAESVHLFGASVPASSPSKSSKYGAALRAAVRSSVVNYYAPTDEVLLEAAGGGGGRGGGRWGGWRPRPDSPLGLGGASGTDTIRGYRDVRVRPENHRFASYAAVLEKFP